MLGVIARAAELLMRTKLGEHPLCPLIAEQFGGEVHHPNPDLWVFQVQASGKRQGSTAFQFSWHFPSPKEASPKLNIRQGGTHRGGSLRREQEALERKLQPLTCFLSFTVPSRQLDDQVRGSLCTVLWIREGHHSDAGPFFLELLL
jgi:hypothetical protein